jgi:hypothetical protein
MGGRCFVETEGEEPNEITESWDWIQAQKGNKKLWVLSFEDDSGTFVAA